jgi:hypothetical protein
MPDGHRVEAEDAEDLSASDLEGDAVDRCGDERPNVPGLDVPVRPWV